jgi:hypothetical protein
MKNLIWILVAILLSPALVGAEELYDVPVTLEASTILPAELLVGPNHKVEKQVTNDGFLNTYTLNSKWGSLEVVSTPILRKRIKELDAMAEMEKLKGSKEFKAGVEQSLKRVGSGAKKLVTDPGGSVKKVGKGVGGVFKSVGGVFKGDKKRGQTEGSTIENVSGFSKVKRQYSEKFGVDPYSRNELLQKELSEISKAGFFGGAITSLGIGKVGGLAVSVAGSVEDFTTLVHTSSPDGLRKYCKKRLEEMKVDKDIIDLFLRNTNYTITEQTAIVTSLEAMGDVEDRASFIKFAVLTDNAELATFRAVQGHLYAVYNEKWQKLARFVHFGEFSCAEAVDGTVVVVAPVDRLLWTEELAKHITALNETILEANPNARRVLWITGTFTPLAETRLKDLGWVLRPDALKKIKG